MGTEAKQSHLPFLTAQARLKNRYGITLTRDDFIEKAYYIWRSIGNIARKDGYQVSKVPDNLLIQLPGGCEFVNTVEVQVDSGRSTEFSSEGLKTTTGYETLIVPYVLNDGYLQITDKSYVGAEVGISYSTIMVDDDGLPMLNDREVNAIAVNVATQKLEIDLFAGKKAAAEALKYIKPEADRLLNAAASPEYISDDMLNQILDVKASWDRKSVGERFKFK